MRNFAFLPAALALALGAASVESASDTAHSTEDLKVSMKQTMANQRNELSLDDKEIGMGTCRYEDQEWEENNKPMREQIMDAMEDAIDNIDKPSNYTEEEIRAKLESMALKDPPGWETSYTNWGDELWEKTFGQPMYGMDPRETSRKFGRIWLRQMGQQDDVFSTKSGLMYRKLVSANETARGIETENDPVTYHYKAMWISGSQYDSSLHRDFPTRKRPYMCLDGVKEALLRMKEGDRWELFIPPHLGYGDKGFGGTIAPNSPLHIIVEMIEVLDEDPENPLDIYHLDLDIPWSGPGSVVNTPEVDPNAFMDDWDDL